MIARGLIASAAFIAVMAGLSAWGWLATPAGAEFPVHWNAAGEPDRYGGKLEAFALLPGLAILMSVIFAAAPLIDPRGRNLAQSGSVLLTVWIGTLGVLAAGQAALTLVAVGVIAPEGELAPRLVLLAVCALLVVLGNALGKARPNWFVGVRTPWTLSSDKAWDVTHRWAGRGFVASGLIGGAALLLAPVPAGLAVFFALIAVTAVGSIALSFLVWRSDPDRETYSDAG
ncbi:MAG: SdpI family protein [Alphaproteobacteria bacterium]|nr:SdpI family protein [Alphaproteobacteria bacterium]